MSPDEVQSTWEAAYRATEYRVELPQTELVLRVDVHDPQQDRRLRLEAGVQARWAIVTPCNPASRRLSHAENTRLLQQLEGIVAGLSLRTVSTRSHDPSGVWPDEPGLLICDPPPGVAEEMGMRFRQNAILAGNLGAAPRLVWLER